MADYKKPDYWQTLARKEGYPARSVYKLKEIDEKFGLIKPAHLFSRPGPFRILDLGAAPGSWSLYVLRKAAGLCSKASNGSNGCFLVSVDLSPLSRQYDQGLFGGENFRFIQGDITDSNVKDSIRAFGPYHLIISDAAPATTGNRLVDTARSLNLCETVVSYAENILAENGVLVIKLFQGGDSAELLKKIKNIFKTGKSYKPQACRNDSFETYYLGMGKIRLV